ncbi:MAG: hypothetical protein ACK5RL_15365 [Acidimicrobiales bacterium]
MMGDHGGFWRLETLDEFEVVRGLLFRRFGDLLDEISAVFDEVDPFDVVYPGNTGEYDDVVREFVVLMQGRDVECTADLRRSIVQSLGYQFDEAALGDVVDRLTRRIGQLELGRLRGA